MRCIFCLKERAPSEEHVFPFAIGGRLTTDRVCTACNSNLGSRVDAALSDSFVVRSRRATLGLAGNSGAVPANHEMLLGVSKFADGSGRRAHTTFNYETGKLDVRALPHVVEVVTPTGEKHVRISVDARDKHLIPKLIERERKRRGLPRLSGDQLASVMPKFVEPGTTIENPQVLYELSFDFSYLRHAMIKIAYELAFIWFGEAYLDDPSAAELRAAICAPDPASTDALPAYVFEAKGSDVFKFWGDDETSHLAYAFANRDGIAVAVRIFDVYGAVVWVTKNAAKYVTRCDDDALRFLSISPEDGTTISTTLRTELLRLIKATNHAAA